MSEDEVVAWLCEEASVLLEEGGGMGSMEKTLDRVSLECRRRALERLVQEAANAQPLTCPRCRQALNVEEHHRERKVNAAFGLIRFERSYGFCSACDEYVYPADVTMGLQERAPASPRVQEICALTALRAPAGQVQEDVRRMTGIDLDAATLHREARRQGERALALREANVALTRTLDGVGELTARARPPSAPFTLVIEIDAWNIRERDNWGLSQILYETGEDTGRWHWVYTGTIFRLDQRGTTASGRPVIAERGFVATRTGLDGFQPQLYAEAIQRGLLHAEHVLILADGAIWIWNLVEDRFKGASQRVDLYHVKEHLWKLANELFGQGTDKAKEWVAPYLSWLQRRKDGVLDVIEGLEGLRSTLDRFTVLQRDALEREIGYFDTHKNRMDYKTGKALGQPVGSGAVESTCSQYQRRFKLPGQFWSLEGDEAFLALATLHRNGRWNQLFPHDSA
ncbi:MAG: ISKra4 family transposase [bacterium]